MTSVVRRHPVASALVAVGLVVAALVTAAVVYLASGAWYVEMTCADGEAPASAASGDNGCFPTDRPLPPGFTFDPGGNQRVN